MLEAHFEEGNRVNVVEPDIYFDDPEEVPDHEPMEVARELIKLVVASQNPALGLDILCLLLGIGFRGCSQQDIASRHGCTRAAVSARMMQLRDQLGFARPIGPTRGGSTRTQCKKSRVMASLV